ncbi:MAG: hypothetical protein FJ137_13665 [Deltaproteobacteria bacterium]|nr:hypothetical protein [Deltaproteobacteria bacterium]
MATDERAWTAVGVSDEDSVNGATLPLPAPAPVASRPPVVEPRAPHLEDEPGVSLADLQGALRELGSDRDGAGTQVRQTTLPEDVGSSNDESDVFGSVGGGAAVASLDSDIDEPTSIRPPRPGTIALVVEDARARERLKKHLEARFSALYEASDAASAAALDELDELDALVFVRPSRTEPNVHGFATLDRMKRRPRVLVISADSSFDGVSWVDLRLPLGQKASEVARQVLDGLEQLGVAAAAE